MLIFLFIFKALSPHTLYFILIFNIAISTYSTIITEHASSIDHDIIIISHSIIHDVRTIIVHNLRCSMLQPIISLLKHRIPHTSIAIPHHIFHFLICKQCLPIITKISTHIIPNCTIISNCTIINISSNR